MSFISSFDVMIVVVPDPNVLSANHAQWKSCSYTSCKSTIIFMIFLDFLMFYQILLPPQVKRSAIVSNKDSIYEFSQEFPNDLRLKYQEISKLDRMIA